MLAQEKTHDGFNRFYYPNGNISSEGVIKDGKPDGYWRNFYDNGSLKSEGNRLNFLLDSTWTFYFSNGQISSEINYRNDQKNGYTFNYDTVTIKKNTIYYLKSKVLYYLGKREGLSYVFDNNGKLKSTVNYQNDKRHGYGKIYNNDSIVITLISYFNDYQIDAQKINRIDDNQQKQGKWIVFYENENKHIECNYLNDKLNGIYKEYDPAENLIKELTYIDGMLYIPSKEETFTLKAETKRDFYENGNLKYEGAFLNNTAVGIHKEYDENGKIKISKEYFSNGKLFGEGLYDSNGLRTGKWRLFDTIYNYFYAEGFYEKGYKEANWKYFYPDLSIEQEGFYSSDNPDREWIWYFPNGKIRCEESYLNGKYEGHSKEYDENGKIIAEGEYFDNDKVGIWNYSVGTIIQKGKYDYSEKTGEWEMLYASNNKKFFIGSFRNGDANGKHIWYYPNGKIMIYGEYRAGKQHNEWKKFDENGNILAFYTFKNGILTKIDGVKTFKIEKSNNK